MAAGAHRTRTSPPTRRNRCSCASPSRRRTTSSSKLLAEHRVNTINEPTYGEQLQNLAVQGLDNEGHMHIDYKEVPVTLGDGTVVNLRHPTYSVDGLKYGPLHPDTMLSPRVAPPMIGVGLLEAIPEADIRAHADPDDKDKDGISGRASEVWSVEAEQAGARPLRLEGRQAIRARAGGQRLRRRHGPLHSAFASAVRRLHQGAARLPQRAQRQQRA